MVRSNGECYVNDGVDSTGCDITKCPYQGSSKTVYIRGKCVFSSKNINSYICFNKANEEIKDYEHKIIYLKIEKIVNS